VCSVCIVGMSMILKRGLCQAILCGLFLVGWNGVWIGRWAWVCFSMWHLRGYWSFGEGVVWIEMVGGRYKKLKLKGLVLVLSGCLKVRGGKHLNFC
jgi:hypothetical protein